MKKFFEYFGIFVLFVGTLIMTDKTSQVVKEQDELMLKIKEVSSTYKIDVKEAVINENDIVPGTTGKVIDINKTYSNMKKRGIFDENYLIYKEILPKEKLKSHLNKYIIKGQKNTISLVFKSNDNVPEILKILKDKQVSATFFVSNEFLNENSEMFELIIHSGHEIGNYIDNFNYLNSSFLWIDKLENKKINQKNKYCLNEEKNPEGLKICTINHNYTVTPNIILKNNLLSNIKKHLIRGSIISMETNSHTIKELSVIINYIRSKGYEIVPLSKHLEE